jgi:tetratricopeptide (TPR) repeat protein
MAERTGDWGGLTAACARLTGLPPARALELQLRLAAWYKVRMLRPDDAVAALEAALRIDPKHTGALAELGDALWERGDWKALEDVLERHRAVEEEPARRLELDLSLAELYEAKLGDPERALAAYQAVLAAEPGHREARDALERLLARQERWLDLAEVYGRGGPSRAPELARLWETRLGDPAKAIAAWVRALEADRLSVEAARALDRLYVDAQATSFGGPSQRWDLVAEAYGAQAAAAADAARKAELSRALGRVLEEELGEPDRAIEAYTEVLAHVPDDPEAQAAFRRLLAKTDS